MPNPWFLLYVLLLCGTVWGQEPPTIVRQPVPQSTLIGDRVVFTVRTQSLGAQYEWHKDGVPIPSETKSDLILYNVGGGDAGSYSVIVRVGINETWSKEADLRVLLPEWQAGVLDTTFNAGFSEEDFEEVSSLLSLPDGRTLIAETLDNRLGKLTMVHADGTLDSSFDSAHSPRGVVRAMTMMGNRILVGGTFTACGNEPCQHLALFELDGRLAEDFEHDNGPNNGVKAIHLLPNGKILIGGRFKEIAGIAAPHIARLEANGTLDPSFSAQHGIDSTVNAIAVTEDDDILVGGIFAADADLPYNHLARLHPNGTLDLTFPQGGANGNIDVIKLQPNGAILLGGIFRSVYGQQVPRLARLHAHGILDESYKPEPNAAIDAILVGEDGRFVVAGEFSKIARQSRRGLARFEADGTLDASFAPPALINEDVRALAFQSDGKILAGGEFTHPHARVLRLWHHVPDTFPPSILQQPKIVRGLSGQEVCLAVSAYANPRPQYTWRFNGDTVAEGEAPELRLRPFETVQAGHYDVTVKNPLGQIQSSRIDVVPGEQPFFEPIWREYFHQGALIPSGFRDLLDAEIPVEEDFTISAIRLWIDIEHPDANDLAAKLIGPNGDEVVLFEQPDRSGRQFFAHTFFDDQAPRKIDDGVAPFLGTYRPEEFLNTKFVNRSSKGVWTLRVTNIFGDTPGRLKAWGLNLITQESVDYESWKEKAAHSGLLETSLLDYALPDTLQMREDRPTTFAHTQWTNASDLVYEYETSQDLIIWTTARENIDYQLSKVQRFTNRTQSNTLTLTEKPGIQFFRLHVRRP